MKRIALALVVLALLAPAAWGNGDVVRYDRSTGVVLPAGPSAAMVDRETLDIEFQPHPDYAVSVAAVAVRAQYWLHNPTDKALKLDIGFPVPGGGMGLIEPPVRFDGQLGDWRLFSYAELLRPLRPSLVRAMQRWADRHPEAIRLAKQMRGPRTVSNLQERRRLESALRSAIARGLPRTTTLPPFSHEVQWWLWPSSEATQRYKNTWTVRSALLATGQRHLLPEGRWSIDYTVLDPATGRLTWPRAYEWQYSPTVSMLIFPVHLRPRGHHHLEVTYRQEPSKDPEGAIWQFAYVLRTVRNWASFGPIETTIRAPSGLVFRSLPALRYAGMSRGLKVYQGTIRDPQRNLQVVLAGPEALVPRLKINGRLHGARWDALVKGTPMFPTTELGYLVGRAYAPAKKMEQGEVVLTRREVGITLQVRPGENHFVVNDEQVALPTPVVVRKGHSLLPLEVLEALYPGHEITLSYHRPSHTVLAGFRPRPTPAMPPADAPGDAAGK